MKTGKRSSLGILAALIAVSTLATTALALPRYGESQDYPEIVYPSNPKPSSPSEETSTPSTPTEEIEAPAAEGELSAAEEKKNVVSNDKLEKAIDKATSSVSAKVKNMKNLVLSADVMQAAADKDIKLKFKSKNLTLVVSGITDPDKVDLSSNVKASSKKTTIVMAAEGELGCTVKYTISKDALKMSKSKLKKAYVYLNGKKLGRVKLDKNGNVVITMTEGGVYTIK